MSDESGSDGGEKQRIVISPERIRQSRLPRLDDLVLRISEDWKSKESPSTGRRVVEGIITNGVVAAIIVMGGCALK